ncbi:U3 small nucleolar RNA-associated protein [Drechslerella dactyloides]|uniref:U3 small nucleolar RNA-associated protein n=1 Tax=Drechslerella dactyloides TaxID=74499 RepID=A0AAD6J3J7_DREDA|nr:U3 small nucleolar RNA-associated protein [Drechslerella dactyloides]
MAPKTSRMGTAKIAKSTRKGGTASSKRHTFQTFTQKIASIKIDPIRRIRRFDDALPSENSSHFFETLTAYNDLYLSANFVDFSRVTTQYTESLPHIVYHQELIVTNIEDAILKSENEGEDSSLQPLLGLVPQLARDLGVVFEKHFERCVKLITGVIMRTKNVEVVEWAFEALAYLLKYLSRLLVEDLRPLYTIVAPLLGKENQKYYTTRFMAEAMSFLIRKSKGEGLASIVQFIARDLVHTSRTNPESNADQYVHGLRTMFVETCMGVDHNLHTRAEPVVNALLAESLDEELGQESALWEDVVTGTIVGLIHKTKRETAGTLLESIYRFAEDSAKSRNVPGFAANLLFTALGTRKGNRIESWARPAEILLTLLEVAASLANDDCYWCALQGFAIIFQQAELEVVLPKLRGIAASVSTYRDGIFFLSFSTLLAESGLARFSDLWFQVLVTFISGESWAKHEGEILMALPKLEKIYNDRAEIWKLNGIPTSALRHVENALSDASMLRKSDEDAMDTDDQYRSLLKLYAYLQILQSSNRRGEHCRSLAKKMKITFSDLRSVPRQRRSHRVLAIMGSLLSILAELDHESEFWDGIWESFPELAVEHGFLVGIRRGLENKRMHVPPQDSTEFEAIFSALEKNLESPSHELRGVSLDILFFICTSTNKSPEESDTIEMMQLIENTAISITTSRNVAMHVRKLGLSYQAGGCGKFGARLLPRLCFGLLTIKFAPLWDEVIATLAKIAEKNEAVVSSLAFSWLTLPQALDDETSPLPELELGSRHVSEFECSNIESLRKLAVKTRDAFADPLDAIRATLDNMKDTVLTQSTARSQALKLLYEMPQVAEKRSRQLVPLFLEWARQRTNDGTDDDEELPETQMKWSGSDQTAMLKIFARFHNPRVLYKADDVYDALLDMAASGDTKRQTVALECIFAWKSPAIRPYQENLMNLFSESNFRDEITNFIQVDKDESIIQEDHRSQLMPVLLRVLYGRSLSRKNAASGSRGMESRRISILASLANFTETDISMFADIAMDEYKGLDFVNKNSTDRYVFDMGALDRLKVSPRKQLGFVNMIEDMVKELGKSLSHVVEPIFDNLMICIVNASGHTLRQAESEFETENLQSYRTIRQVGFRCVDEFFARFPEMPWTRYMPAFFTTLVEPRLAKFAAEHAQSRSGLLSVFVTWSSHANMSPFLVEYNIDVLRQVSECLGVPSVSNDVVLDVISLVQNLVARVEEDQTKTLRKSLLAPYVDSFLQRFGNILEKSLPKEILEKCVEVVSQLAAYADTTAETKKILEISLFLISQPTTRVKPKAKGDILRIIYNVLPGLLQQIGDDLIKKAFRITSSQFSFFRDRENRELLAKVLYVFVEWDESLEEVARFCEDMNAYSMKALDEPDFNKRLAAFAEINEDRYQVLTLKQWTPIVHNMLFFIRDQEELTTRTNASYCLRRFIERVGKASTSAEASDYAGTLSGILLPAVRNGLREASELIRMEYINVLGHVVKECDGSELADMKPLLADGDEEANFFYNILHIQQHRRGRAIRRLAETVEKTPISSSNLAQYLIPLIEHFIFDQDEGAHNLATDAIKTLSVLAANIGWSHYRALFRRYLTQMKENEGQEKLAIRVISGMAEAMLQAKERSVPVPTSKNDDITMNGTESHVPALATSLPPAEKLENDVLQQMLPQLLVFLKQKDESTVSLRVPVAVAIVKLMRVLSDETLSQHLPPVLTSLCHILRSRDQTSRDLTRNTLSEITAMLGPKYFGFVLKELRGALLRGYQLHVLSFTVHAMMVHAVPKWEVGSLDYCASDIMNVVMDDIFGVTASEKEAEGYTKKMKEIKTNKSYDTAEILTSITTLPYLGEVIKPVRLILLEKLNHSIVKKVDELFRRIGLGLTKNPSVKGRDILVFCWELMEHSYRASKVEETVKEVSIRDELEDRFIVNLQSAKSRKSSERKNIYWFKLLRFALDTVRSVLQKHEELMTPENLDAWVNIIGDNIRAEEDEVKISCIRLLTSIIKVPLPRLDARSMFVFVKDCHHILQDSPNTNSELAQASLKLLGAILRERRNVDIKPTILSYVLVKIQPDLVEPDRQGLTFNFLKAVLSRRILVPEVYDVIDEVSKIMIQNHSKGVRESCRGLYFQFLMEYPQSRKKLDKHLSFLVANLEYEHQDGRESVLEVVNLLLTKIGDDLIQDIVGVFFMPLVFVVANDEAEKCRDMALVLMKKLFERADEQRMTVFLTEMRSWLGRGRKEILRRVCFRLWLVYVDAYGKDVKGDLAFITEKITEVAKESMIDEDEEFMEDEEEMEVTWEQLYHALHLWSKLVPLFLEQAKSDKYSDLWKAVRACEGFPHAKVRLMSTKLTGLFLCEFGEDLSVLPLRSGKGLELTSDDLYDIAKSCSEALVSEDLTEELGTQAVKNLVFVGRCFEASKLLRPRIVAPAQSDEADDGAEWGGIRENGNVLQEADEWDGIEQDEEADDEPGSENGEQGQKSDTSSALAWLMHRVNSIIRNDEMIQRKVPLISPLLTRFFKLTEEYQNVIGKQFALKWIGTMIHILPSDDLTSFAVKIIMPLYSLLETENEALNDLKPAAKEILQMLSTKMGTTAYGKAYAEVRSKVTERRRIRKHKRSIQLVTDPERAARKKMRKHERSKESRKEKSRVFRDARRAKYL